jgi:hypothetical protein
VVTYRDPFGELRARVADKRAAIEDQRRTLGPLRRAVLSGDALAAIDHLETVTSSFTDAQLRAIDARLDELAERLEVALAASAALLADLGSLDGMPGARFEREGKELALATGSGFALTVAVPRALGPLEVDARGRVRGDLSVARELLGEVPGTGVFAALAIADGRATLRWDGPDATLLPDAIELLLHVRRRIDQARRRGTAPALAPDGAHEP